MSFSPFLAIGAAIIAVSTASIFIRLAQSDGVPSLAIAAFRMAFAAFILIPFGLVKSREEIRQMDRKHWILIILAGIFLALHFASWVSSLEYTSVASSVVIVTTAPLWVAIASPLVLKEKISKPVILGLAIALAGGLTVGFSEGCRIHSGEISCSFINISEKSTALWGNLLALFGAFFSAGYLMTGRKVREKVSLLSYTLLVYGIAAVILLIIVLTSGINLFHFQPQDYVWFFALALIPQLIGHSTFNWALKFLSAAYVSIALLGEPIGTVILAFLILKETPTILEVFGGVLILLGIYLASRVEQSHLKTMNRSTG